MKIDHQADTRTIHPEVLKELPLNVIMELLKVGNDLRTGVIPPHQFDMRWYNSFNFTCGDHVHCIAGWVGARLKTSYRTLFYVGDRKIINDNGPAAEKYDENGQPYNPPLRILFQSHPSDPQMAADAIEQYVFNYAEDPWKAAGFKQFQALGLSPDLLNRLEDIVNTHRDVA